MDNIHYYIYVVCISVYNIYIHAQLIYIHFTYKYIYIWLNAKNASVHFESAHYIVTH